jgi:hypothetical protein
MACMGVDRKLSPAPLLNNIICTIAVEGDVSLLSSMLYIEVWHSLTGMLEVGYCVLYNQS